MLKRAGHAAAYSSVPIVCILAYAYLTDPRRDDDYDPIAVMVADETLQASGYYTDSAEFTFLVASFDRFKPVISEWARGSSRSRGHEIAIDAAFKNKLNGVRFLISIAAEATPVERAGLVRSMSQRLLNSGDSREEIRAFLTKVEKENTIAGYQAYLGLAISRYAYASNYTVADREKAFRERGLEPYSDAALFPPGFVPAESR